MILNLFKPKPKTKEPLKKEDLSQKTEPKYFEVFGDALNQIEFFKTLTLLLTGLCFFLLITIKTALKKPPLVIRVDQLGETQAVKNVKSQTLTSGPEIDNFANYFLQYLTAWNFYTYETDLERAVKMAAKDYQSKLKDYIESQQIAERIKKDQLKAKLIISEISIENDTPKITQIKVKGFKEIRSYQNPGLFQEIIFESRLTLKKVSRTSETPWGLLVENWEESLFKSK